MIEMAAHIAAIGGSIATVFVAVGVFRLNAKMDRFIGRVEALETAHNTHVNMPGLPGRTA